MGLVGSGRPKKNGIVTLATEAPVRSVKLKFVLSAWTTSSGPTAIAGFAGSTMAVVCSVWPATATGVVGAGAPELVTGSGGGVTDEGLTFEPGAALARAARSGHQLGRPCTDDSCRGRRPD